MTAVIEARGLTKRYGDAKAVDGISFSVARGEIFGLLGPNGAGKTTTILMMLGLSDVSDGEVRVLGLDPAREPLKVKARIGYLPDAVGFYDNMTASENLAFTARLMGIGYLPDAVGFYDNMTASENLAFTARLMGIARAERDARIADALARVRLSDVANKRVATYSRGMRQRLGLAEILMKRAEIAILDEPTSGLDPQATEELLEMIRGLKAAGVSVLLSSHLLDRVQKVCDRVALFQSGKIALLGTVPELAREVLGSGFVVDVEAEGEGLESRLRAIPGVSAVSATGPNRFRMLADRDVRPEAAVAVVNAGGKLRQLAVDEPSLEAIYSRFFQQVEVNGEVRDAA